VCQGLDAGKYFWRSGRGKCFSLDIPLYRTSGQAPVKHTVHLHCRQVNARAFTRSKSKFGWQNCLKFTPVCLDPCGEEP